MILVTGASGLSGSIVSREFARQNAHVKALVRSRERARALETFATVRSSTATCFGPGRSGRRLRGLIRSL